MFSISLEGISVKLSCSQILWEKSVSLFFLLYLSNTFSPTLEMMEKIRDILECNLGIWHKRKSKFNKFKSTAFRRTRHTQQKHVI